MREARTPDRCAVLSGMSGADATVGKSAVEPCQVIQEGPSIALVSCKMMPAVVSMSVLYVRALKLVALLLVFLENRLHCAATASCSH